MFDRDAEWAALDRFVSDDRPGATLGVVSGRRRQGKTFLLDAVVRAAGGCYFGATEAADAESLRRFSDTLTRFANPPTAFHFEDWFEAVDAVLALGRERPIPVVIDEFPYLARANPELPSILQHAFGPLRPERVDRADREVRPAGHDVDDRVREDEVELAALDLTARVVGAAGLRARRGGLECGKSKQKERIDGYSSEATSPPLGVK
jgi:AAA+ ATPase superfamily predicted ATPase